MIKAEIGALLAGGQGRRMGGRDKGALMVGGKSLAERAISHLEAASHRTVIAAPTRPAWLGDHSEIAFASDQVDFEGETIGPVGGLLAALLWAHDQLGDRHWFSHCQSMHPCYPLRFAPN